MTYGCCHLSIVPVRADANDTSEMVTQLLFGDVFEITEQKNGWIKINISFDNYSGWIDAKQTLEIDNSVFEKCKNNNLHCSTDLVEYAQNSNKFLMPIVMGSSVGTVDLIGYTFDANTNDGSIKRGNIVSTALLYLNAPYIWGGKTPFGIDCSGFTQMVYKICGIKLPRDARQQAQKGQNLSFIEETSAGDLAFFDNDEGDIIHVGIMMKDNYIIHAHGHVRIDRIDHTGIFNVETKKYSHKLRVIKHI